MRGIAPPHRPRHPPRGRPPARRRTVPPPPAVPVGTDLKQRLAALRRRLRFVATFRGGAWLAAVVLFALFGGGLLDWALHLPALVRACILAGLLTGAGVVVYRLLFRPLSQPTDDLS